MVDKWNPSIIGIEGVGFQKELRYWLEELVLKERHLPPITEIKSPPNRSKWQHLKSIEPYYRNGMVYHASWMKDLEDELMMLSSDGYKGKHDDLIDALAMQLELLLPGDGEAAFEVPAGSWEFEAESARKANLNNDYFNE
jgi:hypothetical protein